MARAFRLQVLLDLAKRRLDAATQELYRLRMHWDEAQAKLDQLQAYRHEYSAGLDARLREGLPAYQVQDFRLFLAKLQRAIQAQAEEVARRQRAWEAEHEHWLDLRQREQALGVLEQRHERSEAQLEARREQKQQDEFALRAVKENPLRS
jgi:flagellar FliJ protein